MNRKCKPYLGGLLALVYCTWHCNLCLVLLRLILKKAEAKLIEHLFLHSFYFLISVCSQIQVDISVILA